MSPTRLVSANGDVLEIGGHGGTARPIDSYGSVDTYARTTPARPTVEQLRELTATYASEEAEVVLRAEVDCDATVSSAPSLSSATR